MRARLSLFIAFLIAFVSVVPAAATNNLSISSPTSISYDAASNSFPVTGLSVSGSASYVQVELSLLDSANQNVDINNDFLIAVGTKCAFNSTWTNSATGGQVKNSGDNSTNVLIAGSVDNVNAQLTKVWIYNKKSNFCGATGTTKLGAALLTQKLQVSVVESSPGLWYSSATGHYYQLATQTTSDGMGQPTDDEGNITDSSRYFVRWTTARANAKSSTISIGGSTHRGYLAAITTKSEFNFLNSNVSGGSGVLYPAWVGGSDYKQEGTWRWVDGPEAQLFGGDTLESMQDVVVDPEGRRLQVDGYGSPSLIYSGHQAWTDYTALLMRDANGDIVVDQTTGYTVEANANSSNSAYCSQMNTDYWAYADLFYNQGYVEANSTPYGSDVYCDLNLGPYIKDASGTNYYTTYADGFSDGFIYRLDSSGNRSVNANNEYLVVRIGTSDFSSSTQLMPNYDGAIFWGPDSFNGPDGYPNFCSSRGVRGVCNQAQADGNGNWFYNDYYVYWSNGGNNIVANWDGVKNKPGDGVYGPQPDNAFLNNSPEGENALIINWCARNGGIGNTDAVQQSLYGNPGYYCTPGWNDLAAGDWGGASNTYPNAYSYDTPNHIGTTDYVIEYCGYSDESSCSADAVSAAVNFTVGSNNCATNSDRTLTATFEQARVENTTLTSPTMNVFTFDDLATGWMAQTTTTNVGTFVGTSYVADAGPVGGAGGTGKFGSMPNSYLTLPQVSCYVGFWWSAGNAANYVELYDSNNQLLASFSAADLVSRLGNCSGPNSAYCGHPEFGFANGNELYAFVNLRLPAGFKTIRFWGQGFEIDNITTSISIPQHSASETAITTGDVRTDCSTVTATDANANLIACPRTVSIGVGSALDYDPRTDSQIAGYSYPGTTELAGVSVNSGAGSALLNGSGSAITLSSDTEGTYYVDFTISYGGATAVSRLTVNVTASQVVSLIAPDLILIDPRSSNVELGQVLLSGASNASMCVRPVADNQGTPFVGAPNFAINFSLANPLTTQSSLSDYLVLSGLTDDVATDAASVRIESGDRLTVNGAIYIQVSSVGGAASSAAQCDAGSSKIIEIRPLELQASQSLDFVFGLNR